jgi:ATP-binding cassette, subfamily B (MDR/TAP), member 1
MNTGAFLIQTVTAAQFDSADQYAQAGGLATEMLSGIRTVTALNAQPDAVTRYRRFILKAMDIGILKGLKVGLGHGCLLGAMLSTYALGFWYGAKLIADQLNSGCTENCLSGGTVLAVFFCVIMGASALGQMAPPLGNFFSAKAAMGGIVEVLNRKPLIDGLSEDGLKPTSRPKGTVSSLVMILAISIHWSNVIYDTYCKSRYMSFCAFTRLSEL